MKPHKISKEYLLAPGPTPIPPAVSVAGALPIYHHRTPRFESLVRKCTEGMQYLFCTNNDLVTLTSSGTGGMEAAVANLLSPGDTAICASGGKFGERWIKLCQAYGVNPVTIKVPYGETVDPDVVKTTLQQNPQSKAVFVQLSETSTGCIHDVKSIGAIVAETPAIFVVDAISGLGAERCPADAWQIDVMVAGSQKGLMIPPGLAFISLSSKALAAVNSATSPRFYFDLRSYCKGLQSGRQPYTPAVGLFVQLDKALDQLRAETIEGVWNRSAWLGEATRSAIRALGLELFAARPGNVLTAVKVPKDVDGVALVKTMREQFGVTIAGGQGPEMKGKIFRIAHLGYMDRFDVITAISALEIALLNAGHQITLGAGVAAALSILRKEPLL